MKKNATFLFLLFYFVGFSQVETETIPPEYIKTIVFTGNTSESQLPITKLGNPITLEFDVLNGDEADFYYTIEHYNYDWTPSILSKPEYMSGFDNQRIRDYTNSYNTFQIYSHYALTIPNNQVRSLLVSGNYMIKIFDNNDNLMFSRKFMIYEDKVNVGVSIKRSRDVSVIEQKQSVDIVIASNSLSINNPMQTIKALIIQNNNLNSAIGNLKPQYTIGSQLIYKYNTETSFWAGNEYLYFETKDLRSASMGTKSIDLKDLYHTYLYTNYPRVNQIYTYNPDINGNYVITAINTEDLNTEADYAWVHFSLKYDDVTNKDIHVYGNFNNYTIDENTKLKYDSYNKVYYTNLLLKQGFFNYKYVLVDKNGNIDEGAISGNFYQTENNYKVLVYYRNLGAIYDRIIGFGEGSSVNITN